MYAKTVPKSTFVVYFVQRICCRLVQAVNTCIMLLGAIMGFVQHKYQVFLYRCRVILILSTISCTVKYALCRIK